MSRESLTYVKVVGGKLTIIERERFINSFRGWPDCAGTLTVKPLGRARSSQQNKYYWGVVVRLIAQAMTDAYGEDIDDEEAHHQLKARFNLRVIERECETLKIPGSTRRLNTDAFSEYVEKCRNWGAAFFGINIPDPASMLINPPNE